ncbi:hypothetical protein PR048_018570 [Dryococelus australis]|uniref:Tesmin/TSO1-like CXC domain-containing protein n=1 Tax=Dryococelus australis TaxID=614101 RepID=A0ABQ9HCU7_9NEOP|nr:hypothetical protein PR048_018570 [Dryococelus australis]
MAALVPDISPSPGMVRNPIKPEKWGWKKSNSRLVPDSILQAPAPGDLLEQIYCNCKNGCQGACRCRKAGFKCSVIDTKCNGLCDDMHDILEDSDEGEDTETVLDCLCNGINARSTEYTVTGVLLQESCEVSVPSASENLAETGP